MACRPAYVTVPLPVYVCVIAARRRVPFGRQMTTENPLNDADDLEEPADQMMMTNVS